MLFFDMLSNVGGTLGLFVGLSFVSLFEILEIIIEIIFSIFTKIMNNLWQEINNNIRQIFNTIV
jgi:hypothetical protein